MDNPSFNGTSRYLTSAALRDTVNVAIALEKPLLIKGEPGTGKTLLAEAIADMDIPYEERPLFDENGKMVRDYIPAQDAVAWVIQGPVSDRPTEHLG